MSSQDISYITPDGLTDDELSHSNPYHPANLDQLEEIYLPLLNTWLKTKPFSPTNPEPEPPEDVVMRMIYDSCLPLLQHDGHDFIQYRCLTGKHVFVTCNYRLACRFIIVGYDLL